MELEPIETIAGTGGLSARIYQDDGPHNPRKNDNLGRIATINIRRHEIRDKGEDFLPDDLSGWEDVERYLVRERGAVVILPVFMYEHSAMAISTESFIGRAHHAEWDSGQVGFIYATRQDIIGNFMVKRLTKGILKLTRDNLVGEIETFNQYIQGDVYEYRVVRETKCPKCGHVEEESLDSCGGLYGLSYAKKEAMAALEACEKKED